MDLGLSGRTAIVCGASSGMGLAIARALAAEGDRRKRCQARRSARGTSRFPGAPPPVRFADGPLHGRTTIAVDGGLTRSLQ